MKENLDAVLPTLDHGLAILTGQAGECGRDFAELPQNEKI